MTHSLKAFFLLATVLVGANTVYADTRYVTDQFEVTLRTGTSTSNSILSMLKSGQAVSVIEQDAANQYSLVETSDGKQGYVLTRFLDTQPSGRERFTKLSAESTKQRARMTELKRELDALKQAKKDDENAISQLEIALSRTKTELSDLRTATQDTIQVIEQNDTLKARINEMDTEIASLTTENNEYRDSTAMDWFIRGASVSLVAFLLGILVTRIRWKKRDTWGNY